MSQRDNTALAADEYNPSSFHHFRSDGGTITDGGELTHAYSVEEGGESKMTKAELITMIERAGFEAVEMDTVYNRVAAV